MSEFVDPIDYALAADPHGPPLLRGEALERLGADVLQAIAADAEYDDGSYDDGALNDDSELDDESNLETASAIPHAPHVVIDGNKGRFGAKCLNCGESYGAALPIKIENWLAHSVAFVRIHSKCKPKGVKRG